MRVNVCPDDNLLHAEPFTTKLGMVANLVWWCIIMSQMVFQKDWFAVFKVTVTVTDNISKICLFNKIILTADLFAAKLGLMAQHHKDGLSCEKIGLLCCFQGQGHRKS